MNVLKKFSIKSLKLNKKRTIGTIIGIILSTSLICAVAGMFQSLRATLINKAIKDSGYFHVALLNVPTNEVEELELNREIKEMRKPSKLLENVVFRIHSVIMYRFPRVIGGSITVLKLHPPLSDQMESCGFTYKW